MKLRTHITDNVGAQQILPPPTSQRTVNPHHTKAIPTALLHSACVRVGRAVLFLCLLALPFIATSCEKEVERYEEMESFHAESLTLPDVSLDSVARFTEKVNAFVRRIPAAHEDPLFPSICANIRKSLLRFNIYVDDSWDGIMYFDFNGNPIEPSTLNIPIPDDAPEGDAGEAV